MVGKVHKELDIYVYTSQHKFQLQTATIVHFVPTFPALYPLSYFHVVV